MAPMPWHLAVGGFARTPRSEYVAGVRGGDRSSAERDTVRATRMLISTLVGTGSKGGRCRVGDQPLP